ECQEFVKRLNEKFDGLALGLPTEAQWEYACRAGTDSPRYRGNLDEIAWYYGNSPNGTKPVGGKAPNDWGLYDTLGNVWEWCDSVWTNDYKQKKAATRSALRVVRGGSWGYVARDVRSACRFDFGPSGRTRNVGFRCAEFGAPGPVGSVREGGRARE